MSKRHSTRGSIRKRGRDSYEVSFRAGVDPATGEPVRISETVRGKDVDAQRRLTELLRQHDTSGVVPDREMTVATFSKTWLSHMQHRVKPSTLKRYRELLQIHVVPSIGPVRMTELRPAGVQATIDRVLERRSPRTAVNTFRVLSEMLGEATRWGVCSANPAAAVRPPRAPRPKLHVPDQETCNAILERVRGRQVEGPVVLAVGTGMRLAEILGAQNSNVDLERKVMRVAATLAYADGEFTLTTPKTSRARRSVDLPAAPAASPSRGTRNGSHRRPTSNGCGVGSRKGEGRVAADGKVTATTPSSDRRGGRLCWSGRALGRNRTCGPRFRKPLLSPLSYEGML
jgi:integrase